IADGADRGTIPAFGDRHVPTGVVARPCLQRYVRLWRQVIAPRLGRIDWKISHSRGTDREQRDACRDEADDDEPKAAVHRVDPSSVGGGTSELPRHVRRVNTPSNIRATSHL